MKTQINKIVLIVILVIAGNSVLAQSEYPVPGSYEVKNSLTRFEGTWRWTNGTDTAWLVMQKQKVHFEQIPYDGDRIIGWHKYKKGNTVIEDNLQYVGTQYGPSTHLNISIFGSTYSANAPNLFKGSIKDLSKHKAIDLTLTMNAAQNQLVWKTTNIIGTNYGTFDYGFTLPTSMIFIKQ